MASSQMQSQQLICTKPFEWLEISSDQGRSAYLCCEGWLNIPAGQTRNVDGSSRRDIESDVWYGDVAKSIRKSVLDGSFRFCNQTLCPHLSKVDGPVKYVTNLEWQRYLKLYKANAGFRPKTLNLAYDRSCNLACPSCRNDIVMASNHEREGNQQYAEGLIKQFDGDIGELYITGSGDPFASRHYFDLLTGPFLKNYKDIKLRLHTNAQLLTPNRWKKIAHLGPRISLLEVSIDGACKKTYEINRHPGKWEPLMENMAFIAQLRKDGEIPFLKVTFVVQKNNWREMGDFVEMGRKWNADLIFFMPLNNWGTYRHQEYEARAVHRHTNIEHDQFVDYLRTGEIQGEDVDLGAFADLI